MLNNLFSFKIALPKQLEKFRYCFCLEKHFYKIYKTYNNEFSVEFLQNIYLYDFYYAFPTY